MHAASNILEVPRIGIAATERFNCMLILVDGRRASYKRSTTRIGVSMSNEEFRFQWVRDRLSEVPAGQTLLDVGAGECFYKPDASHLKYVAQDLATYDGKGDGKGLQTREWNTSQIDIVCDLLDIPEDTQYDVVLCSEVLEHVPDAPASIRKMCRLVKPGGQIILTAPFISMTHFAPQHFATGFSRYFYEYHLAAAGFELVRMDPNGNIFELAAQEFDRGMDLIGVYSDKPMNNLLRRLGGRLTRLVARYGARHPESSEIGLFGWNVVARRG